MTRFAPSARPRPALGLVAPLAALAAAASCSVVNVADDPLPPVGEGGTSSTTTSDGGGATGGGTTSTSTSSATGGGGAAPGCGDGFVDEEAGESCDPPSSCPTSCNDDDPCTSEELVGSAAECTAHCEPTFVTACLAEADGCCPDDCTGQSDIDCAECGNHIVELGETCDPPASCPANCLDVHACTADAQQGTAGECNVSCEHTTISQCTSNDGCCPAGCTASQDDDCGGMVFATSSNGSSGFYGYYVATNAWVTLPAPPSVTFSQLTTDGGVVFLMGSNNTVYRYTPSTAVWSVVGAGPSAMTGQPIGFFKWTPHGFFYGRDFETTLYRGDAVSWESATLPVSLSCAGSYDASSDLLYIRVADELGLMIWSPETHTLVQHWPNAASCGENSRTGSYLEGDFFTRDWSSPFQRMDVATGVVTATTITPSESHTASDTNPARRAIYVGPYSPTGTTFQVYDPAADTITNLAPLPASVSNHSTVVFVARPQ